MIIHEFHFKRSFTNNHFHELSKTSGLLSVYIDMGKDNDDSASFTFTFGDVSSSNGRQWEIKVAQIPCFSNYR